MTPCTLSRCDVRVIASRYSSLLTSRAGFGLPALFRGQPMTPEQAYDLAKFQSPGVVLVVGATEAIERQMTALPMRELDRLSGDWTWLDYDMRKRLGFVPRYIARKVASIAMGDARKASDADLAFLHKCTREQRIEWLKAKGASQ